MDAKKQGQIAPTIWPPVIFRSPLKEREWLLKLKQKTGIPIRNREKGTERGERRPLALEPY